MTRAAQGKPGPPMFPIPHSAAFGWDIWAAGHSEAEGIKARQRSRLASLVSFARRRSVLYRELYSGLPESVSELSSLPPVSKTDLMQRFDDWVTDSEVTLASVQAFVADPERAGERYLGRYAVWKSSGTTGHQALFLHDDRALAIYDLLSAIRGWTGLVNPFDLYGLAASGGRMACILATGGHFAGISSWFRLAHDYPWLAPLMRDYSVMTPLPELVAELNDWQPAHLVAYPSMLALLATEQLEGRLHIDPMVIFSSGECLKSAERELVSSAFGARLRDIYASSECDYIAFGCEHGWLHVNADWVILEPVDAELEPVPAGVTSHSCLLTNLANFIQPIIRYDLADSIVLRPDPCPCGGRLPAIQVAGRRDQILRFSASDGRPVVILPMAISTVLDEIAGLRRFQIIQQDNKLSLRCEFEPGADAEAVRAVIRRDLQSYLAGQGLGRIGIAFARKPPSADPLSGKFHQVSRVEPAMNRDSANDPEGR